MTDVLFVIAEVRPRIDGIDGDVLYTEIADLDSTKYREVIDLPVIMQNYIFAEDTTAQGLGACFGDAINDFLFKIREKYPGRFYVLFWGHSNPFKPTRFLAEVKIPGTAVL